MGVWLFEIDMQTLKQKQSELCKSLALLQMILSRQIEMEGVFLNIENFSKELISTEYQNEKQKRLLKECFV